MDVFCGDGVLGQHYAAGKREGESNGGGKDAWQICRLVDGIRQQSGTNAFETCCSQRRECRLFDVSGEDSGRLRLERNEMEWM